jgi:hypothetical protein
VPNWLRITLALALTAGSLASAAVAAPGRPVTMPHYDHIVVMIEENKG